MKSVVCVTSVLLAAGSAMAAPFQGLAYEAGGGLPGIVGQGFAVSGGGFFVADGAGTNATPGGTGSFNASNEYEFDSHFALDSFGPSARNRSAGSANNSSLTLNFYGDYGPAGAAAADYNEGELIGGYSLIVGPGSHIGDDAGDGDQPENQARAGIGVAPPPVVSGFAPNESGGRSANNGVFVGRFTTQAASRGAALTGGIFFSSLVMPGDADSHDLVLGGPAVSFRTNNGDQNLVLRAYRVGTVDVQNPSAATDDGVNGGNPFGLADVWDLWVHTAGGPPPNEAPIVEGLPDENCYTINVGDNFSDILNLLGPEMGDTVMGSLDDLNGAQAAGLSAIFAAGDPSTLSLSWTPDAGDVGTYNFVLNLVDEFQATAAVEFQIKVVPTPGAFALLGLGGLTVLRRRRA